MSLRNRPFKEWTIVYYDPSKTTIDTMNKRLSAKGCPRAKNDPGRPVVKKGMKAELLSPVYVPGDRVQILVGPAKKKTSFKARIRAPKGWESAATDKLKGGKRLYSLLAPKKAKQGKYPIYIDIKKGSSVHSMELSVELVRQVR